jgi:TetR/AcrR family transcriptional regulator, regulator of cefoperazone and chloramphenicol sensitivity
MKAQPAQDETKDRILRTAGEVFGAHGFDGTTIREITEKAGVNVAAVNYHFRDKSELYLRVLREAKCWNQDSPLLEHPGSPEEQLRGFIFAFVRNLLDPNRPVWHVQVITQEMLHPTPALDVLVRELTEPVFSHVRCLVGKVAGVKLSGTQLDLLASSIMGQCLFYVRSRPMIARLAPELSKGAGRIDRIAEHITTFSLAALCNLYQNKRPDSHNGRTPPRKRTPAPNAS